MHDQHQADSALRATENQQLPAHLGLQGPAHGDRRTLELQVAAAQPSQHKQLLKDKLDPAVASVTQGLVEEVVHQIWAFDSTDI